MQHNNNLVEITLSEDDIAGLLSLDCTDIRLDRNVSNGQVTFPKRACSRCGNFRFKCLRRSFFARSLRFELLICEKLVKTKHLLNVEMKSL